MLLGLVSAACASTTPTSVLRTVTLASPLSAASAHCGSGPTQFSGRLIYESGDGIHQISCAADDTVQDAVVVKPPVVAISPDHHMLMYIKDDQYFTYSLLTGASQPFPFPDGPDAECISWSPDMTQFTYKVEKGILDAVGSDSSVYLYNLSTGQARQIYEAPSASYGFNAILDPSATGTTYYGRTSCTMPWLDSGHFLFDRFTGDMPGGISVSLQGDSPPAELAPNTKTLATVSPIGIVAFDDFPKVRWGPTSIATIDFAADSNDTLLKANNCFGCTSLAKPPITLSSLQHPAEVPCDNCVVNGFLASSSTILTSSGPPSGVVLTTVDAQTFHQQQVIQVNVSSPDYTEMQGENAWVSSYWRGAPGHGSEAFVFFHQASTGDDNSPNGEKDQVVLADFSTGAVTLLAASPIGAIDHILAWLL